ncbi:MAG: GGDEF domain-containing protein [Nitrospirae bacterium]|nr:GGDEF domain-containing protein [Nitrospirota bacterium]MBI4847258.1 GGDEF domain-containing protein [Nitrospirota bacterium]
MNKEKYIERQLEQKFRSLVDSTEDSIYLLDRHYRYLFVNKKHLSRMGLSDNEYIGKPFGEIHSFADTKVFTGIVDKVFESGQFVHDEYRSNRDGQYFLQTFSPVKNEKKETIAVTIVSKNITKLKLMEEQLRTLSLKDELTGLYNRRGVFTLAEHLFKQANRKNEGLFLLYADLDNFKRINDTYGHQEGDTALAEVAQIFRNNYRDSDVIGRIGGDEFVVVLVGTSHDNINMIANHFRSALDEYNAKDNLQYNLSISIGVVYYDPKSPRSFDELLSRADALMYEQKRQKHNNSK